MKNKKQFKKEVYIQSILVNKTKSSLRISFVIFLSFLVLFSTIIITSIGEYSRLQKDYYDNHNTHIIEIDSKSKSSFYEQLNFNDIDIIKKLSSNQCHVWCEHKINFGITNNNDENYYIYSYSHDLYDKINLKFEDDLICYSGNPQLNNKTIFLKVPIINITSGNFDSFDFVELKLNCKLINESNITPVNSVIKDNYNIIVSEKTYYDIINYMFNLNKQGLINEIKNENNLGVSPVNKILVYCDDIKKVDLLASQITKNKYNTDYVFNYFEDINESIEISKISIVTVLFVLLIVTSINLLSSFELYFKNLQKDLGILKHYGYTSTQIFRIYINKFLKWFCLTGIFIILYNLILSYFTIQYKLLNYFILICISEIVYIIILFLIIQIMLWKKCNKNTLNLIKFSKEFE